MTNSYNDFYFRPFPKATNETAIPEGQNINECPDIIIVGDQPIKNFQKVIGDRYNNPELDKPILKQGYDNYIYIRGRNPSVKPSSNKPIIRKIYLYYVPNKLIGWPFLWTPLETAEGKNFVEVDIMGKEVVVIEECFIWKNVLPLPDGSDKYCLIAQIVNMDSENVKQESTSKELNSPDGEGENKGQGQSSQEKKNLDVDKTANQIEQKVKEQTYFNVEKYIREGNLNIAYKEVKPEKKDAPDMHKRVCLKNTDTKTEKVKVLIDCQDLEGASVSFTCNTREGTTKDICLSKTAIEKDKNNVCVGITTDISSGFYGLITCNFWIDKAKEIPDDARFSITVVPDDGKQLECCNKENICKENS
ncbi:hypothetical protein EXW29_09525 [Bacillus toyonensis]|uniref:hypothetical protein n=1 Tax=Bacillus toyonensis TaxID=155322 RepID=UPI001C027662|nr:hypothetical protein [Bacillus toyonensis]QWH88413.1 hypothetical protein EXW29_09525 [Bacillus toyonensis]QWI31588.1 hypothetical protein EXW25_09515 [Bacillus toyonensis]